MLYLDNDILAKYARPNPDPQVVQYLKQHHAEPWAISSIVAYEFLSYYDQQAQQQQLRHLRSQIVDEITSFTAQTALAAANLRRSLANANTTLDTGDLLIAATAQQHSGTLATANKNDFDKQPIHQLVDIDIISTS